MDERLCDHWIPKKVDDYPFCNRPATFAVLVDNVAKEYLCTQHANKILRKGLASNVKLIDMREAINEK